MNVLFQGNVLFGLLAAFFWGGGDFSGGMGVKHAGGSLGAALRILLLSHSASFSVLLLLATLRGDHFPHGAPLVWGLIAGVAGGLSLSAFYIALARGSMGASAAVSGLLAAAIPAAVSMMSEGFPGTSRLLGFLIAGIAIWMIAAAPTGVLEAPAPSTMGLAILAGAGFGIYFVALKMAGAAGVIWPMATARMGSISTCALLLLWVSNRPSMAEMARSRFTRAAVLWALSTAALDTSGNLLFLSATRSGRLDVAAVLASLYPASTILLAAWVLKERCSRRQGIGMAIAAAAVVLITL
ncbi:MAG TPA: DMT family transporter [Granulicella sp.]|nr:DMT family transporter [Granulicella sp.]